MTTTEPTVFFVDDDNSIRDAIKGFLALSGVRVETFASAEEFLRRFNQDCVGCVLLDLQMPGMSGLELQQALVSMGAQLPIVMLTAHGEVWNVRAALKGGALDFLEKPIENDILLDVVRHALSCGVDVRRKEVARGEQRQKISRLTRREREVMGFLAEGRPHRDIAQTLGISPRTVEVYKARMMEKLQAHSVADIVRLWAQDGDSDT